MYLQEGYRATLALNSLLYPTPTTTNGLSSNLKYFPANDSFSDVIGGSV